MISAPIKVICTNHFEMEEASIDFCAQKNRVAPLPIYDPCTERPPNSVDDKTRFNISESLSTLSKIQPEIRGLGHSSRQRYRFQPQKF